MEELPPEGEAEPETEIEEEMVVMVADAVMGDDELDDDRDELADDEDELLLLLSELEDEDFKVLSELDLEVELWADEEDFSALVEPCAELDGFLLLELGSG